MQLQYLCLCSLTHEQEPVLIGYGFGDDCTGDARDLNRVQQHLVTVQDTKTHSFSTDETSYKFCLLAYCQGSGDHCTFSLSGKARPTGGDVPMFIIIGGIALAGGLVIGAVWMFFDNRKKKKHAREREIPPEIPDAVEGQGWRGPRCTASVYTTCR